MKRWKSAVMALLLLLLVGCGAAEVPDSEEATGQSQPSEVAAPVEATSPECSPHE